MATLLAERKPLPEKYGRKSVRKNVTIPAWLDTFGEQAGINYSQVLREGLERRYNDLQNA